MTSKIVKLVLVWTTWLLVASISAGSQVGWDSSFWDKVPLAVRHASASDRKDVSKDVTLEKSEFLRYDSPSEAQKYYLKKRLAPGEKRLPVEKYIAGAEHIKSMPRHSTASENKVTSTPILKGREASTTLQSGLQTWSSLGPGNVGGRTRALLIDSTSPNVMYAAGVAGGVWKSPDAGSSWAPLSDFIPNLAVTTLAMDPSNHNVIYAGTGEGYYNFDAVRGAGIFKTTDAGVTWTHLQPPDYYPGFDYIFKIVVSPSNPNNVYAATDFGVFASFDGGQHWVISLVFGDSCSDLVIRTDKTTDYLFVACGLFDNAILYRNKDASTQGTNGWEAVLYGVSNGRTSLALAPSNQDIIYAMASKPSTSDRSFSLQAIYRSNANGDANSWTIQNSSISSAKLNTLLLTNPQAATAQECGLGGSFYVDQGWYDNVLAVDPVNPNRLWAGGIDLFRSDDGGVNWGIASYWWARGLPQYVHADQHAILFHPQYNGTTNRKLLVGNDGGLFRTDDALAATASGPQAACAAANTAFSWVNLNHGYAVTQFYEGMPYPDGTTYFGGTQDNGTIRGTDAGGGTWSEILGGDGGYVAQNPQNTSVLYASTPGISFRKSIDGGSTFSDATSGIRDFGLFVTPFVMDTSNSNRLWTGGVYLWRTNDGAATWQQASAATAGNGLVSAIAVSPSDPNRVVVGMSDGYILKNSQATSTNAGVAWDSVLPRVGFVSSLAFDPKDPNVVYATYSTLHSYGTAHVYKSQDGGSSWQPSDGFGDSSLPDIPAHSIVVNPNVTSRLYVGTDLGVFVSLDGGLNWAVENTGFPNVTTESLRLDASGANLFAFTHGRGAWRVPLRSLGVQLFPEGLDFGNQHQNSSSAPRLVTVTNVTGSSIIITSITVGGAFSQTNSCSTLAPQSSCQISVTFSPMSVGTVEGTVSVQYSGAGSPQTVAVKGYGFTGPAVSLSPTSITFPVADLGVGAPQPVTVTNTGDGDLHIQSIQSFAGTLTDQSFVRLNMCPDVLSPGASCSVFVKNWSNVPTSGHLYVYSDAVDSPNTMNLSSQGIPANDPLAPMVNHLAPQSAPVGSTSSPIEVAGANLPATTVILYDGIALPTTYAAPFFRSTLGPDQLRTPGAHNVSVRIPGNPPKILFDQNFDVYINAPVGKIIFDPFARKLYGTNDNSVFYPPGAYGLYIVDPQKGVEKFIPTSYVSCLALSQDGRYLYLGGGNSVSRFNTESQAIDGQFNVAGNDQFGPFQAYDMLVLPTDNKSVLVSYTMGPGPDLYRDGVLVPNQNPVPFYVGVSEKLQLGDIQDLVFSNHSGDGLLQSGDQPYTIYGLGNYHALDTFIVGNNGVSIVQTATAPDNDTTQLKIEKGVAYSNSGVAFDPKTLQKIGRYDIYSPNGDTFKAVFPDTGRNRVTFSYLYGFQSYNLTTRALLGYVNASGYVTGANLAFWAPDGVATSGGGIHITTDPSLNPYSGAGSVPMANSVSPGSINVGSHNLFLHVTGSNFNAGSIVRWNGQDRTTTVLNSTTLVAAIPTSDLANTGNDQVTVFNSGVSGGLSSPVNVAIVPNPLTISPRAVDFGVQVIGYSSSYSVNVSNTYSQPLSISGVVTTTADVSQTNNCGTALQAGASCTVNLEFRPGSYGLRSGSLKVTSDVYVGEIPVQGNGFDFQLTLSRPNRPHRGSANLPNSTFQVAIRGLGTQAASVQLSCSIPNQHFSCKISPTVLSVGPSETQVAVTLENHRSRRLRTREMLTNRPVTVTGRIGDLVRTITVVQ